MVVCAVWTSRSVTLGIDWSPDGQQLLYARIEQSNSDFIATTLR